MNVLVLLYQTFLCCIFATLTADGTRVNLPQKSLRASYANVSSCIFCLELYGSLEYLYLVKNASFADEKKVCGNICSSIKEPVVKECDQLLKDMPRMYSYMLKGTPSNKYCDEARFCTNATNTSSNQIDHQDK